MNWIDALHNAIEEVDRGGGSPDYPELIEALGQIRDFLQDNPEAWEGERNKVAGPRWKVGDRFRSPPQDHREYKFEITDVSFMPHYGEWTYTCRFDDGEEDDLSSEDLEWNVQI